MSPQLIIAAIIAALGFGSAWQIQSWRFDAREKDRAEQILVNQRAAAASDIRRLDNIIGAQNRATARMAVLRRDADGSRSALIGLSNAADSALRSAQDSHAACTERAITLAYLLRASAAEYRALGEIADRHASDVKTLTEAWPR